MKSANRDASQNFGNHQRLYLKSMWQTVEGIIKKFLLAPPNIHKVNMEVHDSGNRGQRRHPPTMGS